MNPLAKMSLTIFGSAVLNELTILGDVTRSLQEETHDDITPLKPGLIRVPMWTNPNVHHDDEDPEPLPDTRKLQTEEVAEHGDGHGTHFVGLQVGTPSQLRTMIINTNSDFTAFPCIGCFAELVPSVSNNVAK